MCYCILLAGVPASGKTTLGRRLAAGLGIPFLSKDDLKEILFDEVGFTSRVQKVALGTAAMRQLYYMAGSLFAAGIPCVLENNFENASRPALEKLLAQYNCRAVTVRLEGDMRAVYKRMVERDSGPGRHPGHISNTSYPVDGPPAYLPPSFEAYCAAVKQRGMLDFSLGALLPVEVTDIGSLDFAALMKRIQAEIA